MTFVIKYFNRRGVKIVQIEIYIILEVFWRTLQKVQNHILDDLKLNKKH